MFSTLRKNTSPNEVLLAAAVLTALAGAAPAQRQFDELGKRALPNDRSQTAAIAQGDVDGDGNLDLVAGNDGQNRLYLNDGTGNFTDVTATHLPTSNDITRSVVLGDIDGDGDLDLVVGNSTYGYSQFGQQNRLYINDGTGTFTDATAARMPVDSDPTQSVVLGDVDGDGDLDMMLGSGTLIWFSPGGNYYRYAQQNRLYLNDGTGTFADATGGGLPVDADHTNSVALVDVDGDGDLDAMLGNGGQERLYVNNGAGVFADATASNLPIDNDNTTTVAFADVDGDGDQDALIGNLGSNRLLVNNGAGTFADATASGLPSGADSTTSIGLGDVDGDGDLDAVVCNSTFGSPQDQLYLNDGTGTFTDASLQLPPAGEGWSRGVALGDFDADGDLDIALGQMGAGGERNRLYLNDGAGTYVDATALPLFGDGGASLDIALGDVDGDGDLDAMFGRGTLSRGRQDQLYLNDGTGTFTDATSARMPVDAQSTRAVEFADVDGDGDLDALLASSAAQDRLYFNDGAGVFTDATAGNLPADADFTTSLAVGDVDGDGDLDVVFGIGVMSTFPPPQRNRLYLNSGRGAFTDATATKMPVDGDVTQAVALGDVDGDGDLDLVVANSNRLYIGGQQNRLYLNDGTGTFSDATAVQLPAIADVSYSVALGDVDADGDQDILFGNVGQSRLLRNDGSGNFTDFTSTHLPANNERTHSVVLGDIDGDGDLDLVAGNGVSIYSFPGQQNRLYLNDGRGTYSDVTATRMSSALDFTHAVALGDVDLDGDLDLLATRYGGSSRLYFNLLRQLDAPFVLRNGGIYTLDVYARYGPANLVDVALPYLGLIPANVPLGPLGTLMLDPSATLALPPFVIQQPAGVGSVEFVVPNVPGFIGQRVYGQALLLPYPLQERLTNRVDDVLIR